jgi:hypothetical protein
MVSNELDVGARARSWPPVLESATGDDVIVWVNKALTAIRVMFARDCSWAPTGKRRLQTSNRKISNEPKRVI